MEHGCEIFRAPEVTAERVPPRLQNVRLAVACCTFQLLRIYAPESPYSDAEVKVDREWQDGACEFETKTAVSRVLAPDAMQRIFRLLSRTLGSLAHPNNPHFEACLKLVSLVNEVRAWVGSRHFF